MDPRSPARDAPPQVPTPQVRKVVPAAGAAQPLALHQHRVNRDWVAAGEGLERRARHLGVAAHRAERAVGHCAPVVAVRRGGAGRRVQRRVQLLEEGGREPVVAVEERDALPARSLDAHVACCRRALRCAAAQPHETRVALRVCGHDTGRVVARAVVDDQRLPGVIALCKQAVERACKRARRIAGRNHERRAWGRAHDVALRRRR
jgi:hypothetical protein